MHIGGNVAFQLSRTFCFATDTEVTRFAESAQRLPSVTATANKLVTFSAFHPQNYIYIFCYVEAQRRQSVHRCCFDLRAGATWVFRVVTHADSTLWQVPWNNSSGPVQRFVINLSMLNAYSKWSVEWAEQNTDVLKKFINWPPRYNFRTKRRMCQGKRGCMVTLIARHSSLLLLTQAMLLYAGHVCKCTQ